jgi:hypothetical protein
MASIIALCSFVYVVGGYHMVPTSLPYLRDLVDCFMIGLAIASFVQAVKESLIDFLLRNR